MATHWVKALKNITRHDIKGAYRTYRPGDWFECNNQELALLLSERKISVQRNMPAITQEITGGDCVIVITGGELKRGREFVASTGIPVVTGNESFPDDYSRYLWWHTDAPLRLDLMPLGFHRVGAGWQTAIPLWRYNTLARDVGTPEARQRTEDVIHDLRVPVFDTRLIYIRRDDDTEHLLALWLEERKTGDDDKLCFMRALYAVKPLNCALPVSWVANGRK